MKFAEIIIPLPLYRTFTYSIPDNMENEIKIGCRVLVQFGLKKLYTGIIASIHNIKPEGYEVKPIIEVLDDYPILRHPQLKFWEWISSYYLCSLGDVYKAAVPAGMKVESETEVMPNLEFADTDHSLTPSEAEIFNYIALKNKITPAELMKETKIKSTMSIISSLLKKEAIYVSEKKVDKYVPKTEVMVELNVAHNDHAGLQELFHKIRNGSKQETAFLTFLKLSLWMGKATPREVSREQLNKEADTTNPIIKAMVDKGIFKLVKKEKNRFDRQNLNLEPLKQLSGAQHKAHSEIVEQFKSQNIVLLHGVTSSGKTEIYTHLIQSTLDNRMQALYLVPEIALTTQLTSRLQKVFGDKLLIYHSKFSDNERVDIWKKLLNSNEPCVVIGVRSSIFLPFSKLGLIIVDEEHETSYKQQDPAPRYNARDAAMILARMHGAKTLLGSATPSINTYFKAQKGDFGLVELSTRFEGIEMPKVRVIDTTKARNKRKMNGVFSQELITECHKAINRGEQAILFQNRRGYSPMIRCKECAWTPKCRDCDVTLTYHKVSNSLVCHYCGYTIPLPTVCPACLQPTIEVIGYGTERIEDDVESHFPNIKISRMDLDTTRSKTGYDHIIEDFSEHKTQILVGTQMVTKGLDFADVSIVGILNADNMINFPDFRSHERAFNMMEQVAGRAGRKNKQGLVLIQTTQPDNKIINFVVKHDYQAYYKSELKDREMFNYPPYSRIINIYIKHRDSQDIHVVSELFASLLRKIFGKRVLGPQAPSVSRVQQFYIQQIMLKVETTASMSKVKEILRSVYEQSLQDPRMKRTLINYDVDPM